MTDDDERIEGHLGATSALAALALLPLAFYGWAVMHRIGHPFELEWMEGGSLELVRRAARGDPLYLAPTLDFTPWSYPPLHPLVSAAVTAPWEHSLTAVRAVSVVSSVLALVAIGTIVQKATGRILAGLVAAGAFAGTYQLSGAWLDTARVDSLMLAFLLVGVVAAQRSRTPAGGVVVGLLFFAAVATKQTAAVVVISVLAWLLLRRRPAGIAAGAVVLGLVGAGWWWSDRTSDGWFTEFVVRILPSHEMLPDRMVSFWTADLAVPFLPTLVLVAGAAVMARRRLDRSEWRDATSFVRTVAGALVVAAWLGRFHVGGASNVLIPGHVAVSLLLGCAVGFLPLGSRRVWRRVVVLGVVLQIALVARPPQAVIPPSGDLAAGEAIIATLRSLPGRVVLVDHPHYLTMAGQAPVSHVVALTDVQRSTPGGRARQALAGALDLDLATASVIVLDRPADIAVLGPVATRDFVALPRVETAPAVLVPVGGIDGQPSAVFVRRGVSLTGLDLTALGVRAP